MLTTHRATVPALEGRIGKKDKIMDHGFIRLVDYMGNDAAITEAAPKIESRPEMWTERKDCQEVVDEIITWANGASLFQEILNGYHGS